MAVQDASHRGWSQGSTHAGVCLNDKFEVIKEIGDGSFGSVALARVRGAGAHVARRGTLVAIKTMKKTFESFAPCLELREIIFLRTLPNHPHLVPALDIFLDPFSKKLHVAMEYMDGNLYQLMKARDHKPFDGSTVKSILFQILSGLEHIHSNAFFHRDIKPENILVSLSAREEAGGTFKRYSQLITPPSTPPTYTVKIADFGLAREIHSKLPYTTYVSTRWYRAPEVLLRAGEYSAPVDIWAIGAMAVEIATLKPLFPGSNEVDQVWRVCDIMGSPGNWVNKQNAKVGGGPWKDGIKLAQKLGFSFPKMAPHTLDTVLQAPQWPPSLSQWVTWCLMWDPNNRPTTAQCLNHEYFADAFDPLRPKSSSTRILARRHDNVGNQHHHQASDSGQSLTSKTSAWFRKSLITRESAPAVPQHVVSDQTLSPQPSPVKALEGNVQSAPEDRVRPAVSKRNTWTHGAVSQAAPMPILPSIRPVSPVPNQVTAQAEAGSTVSEQRPFKKLGRQLSVNGNHYADIHRQEAERALNGQSLVASPSGGSKESFFSHLRKRARRLSGRHQLPLSPRDDDMDNIAGQTYWANNPSVGEPHSAHAQQPSQGMGDLDRAIQNVRYSMDAAANAPLSSAPVRQPQRVTSNPNLNRFQTMPAAPHIGSGQNNGHRNTNMARRRAANKAFADQYETPDEQEELLDEALASAHAASMRLDRQSQRNLQPRPRQPSPMHVETSAKSTLRHSNSDVKPPAPYPTPSPSARKNNVYFGANTVPSQPTQPVDINDARAKHNSLFMFPTPPDDGDNEWAAAAAASIFAAGEMWR